jgi:hypothetical protein
VKTTSTVSTSPDSTRSVSSSVVSGRCGIARFLSSQVLLAEH